MMRTVKFWVAILVGGLIINILDFLVQGLWFTEVFYSKMPEVFKLQTDPTWVILGDFVAVFILGWVYDKVYQSFSAGWRGGATFGFYAGVLVNFPAWIFAHLMVQGISYGYAWTMTVYGVFWAIIAGAVLGAFYQKEEPTPAA